MLKLNVGYSRKVGEADFGSRGASVNVEVELDAAVIREPDRLRGQIQHLFEVAETSVNEELNSPQATVSRSPNNGTNGNGQNGHRNGVANGSSNGWPRKAQSEPSEPSTPSPTVNELTC